MGSAIKFKQNYCSHVKANWQSKYKIQSVAHLIFQLSQKLAFPNYDFAKWFLHPLSPKADKAEE